MGQSLSARLGRRRPTAPARPAPGDSGRLPNLFPTDALPPPPEDIITNLAKYRNDSERSVYDWPEGDQDDPVRALYRLYEYMMLDIATGMRNIIEYFWLHPSWKVEQIPDPHDQDPSRYAAVACISELLVLAFNRKIEMGAPRNGKGLIRPSEVDELLRRSRVYESAPAWAERVPALGKMLVIPTADGDVPTGVDDDRASASFLKKNILTIQPHIYFI